MSWKKLRRGPTAPRLFLALVVALAPASIGLACQGLRGKMSSGADLARVQRWWILIGASPLLEGVDWREAARDTQLVILGGDPQIPPGVFPRGTVRLGYLSVGEADPRRPYWGEVRGAPFLVEPDPYWTENVRVDVRDPRWQQILLDQAIPHLLDQGFDGLMLDTIDTVPYLESKDAVRFAGSRQALRDLLRTIRDRFPSAALVANGTTALADAAPFVDGFVVEGVFATYDFGRRLYRATTAPERDWKLARIADALAVARRPVFTIEYADVGDLALTRWAESEATQHGFKPYVGVRDLNTLP
ncbi:MAG TPA: endo alpha-1,4 polygalactosaminidase [Polyangia bacterium]|nr:endo alpha-1,4 polygalactosaminidase [Polyangia bacterium]